MRSCFTIRGLKMTCFLLTALVLPFVLSGCGGGGGGNSAAPADVTGKVLRGETNVAPNPAATVSIGGKSVATQADGTFTLTGVPSNATTANITASGSQARQVPITLKPNVSNDLGTLFLTDNAAGYTATVTGRIVTQDSGQPVGNATVSIASVSTSSKTDGTFSLAGLPVDLGASMPAGTVVGSVKANGFEDKPITVETLGFPLVKGANPIGDIRIASPVGSLPPGLPSTVRGVVTVQGQKPSGGVTITLTSNGNNLGTTTTDTNGNYSFWVVPATYTVTANFPGFPAKSAQVTLARLDTPVTAPTINLTP